MLPILSLEKKHNEDFTKGLERIGIVKISSSSEGTYSEQREIKYNLNMEKIMEYYLNIGENEAAEGLEKIKKMFELDCFIDNVDIKSFRLRQTKSNPDLHFYCEIENERSMDISGRINKILKMFLELGYEEQVEQIKILRLFDERGSDVEMNNVYRTFQRDLFDSKSKAETDFMNTFERIRQDTQL